MKKMQPRRRSDAAAAVRPVSQPPAAVLSLLEAVQRYRAHLRAATTLRPTTREDYYRRCNRFARAVSGDLTTADLSRSLMREHLLQVRAEHPLMVGPLRAALRHWVKWMRDERMLTATEEDLCDGLNVPSAKGKRGKPVTDDITMKLFAACDALPYSEFRRARARAVLAVLAYAGLRRQEVCDLRLQDVDFEQSSIFVRDGKGGKTRTVYPCGECLDALRDYLTLRPDCRHDSLFAHDKGKGLAASGIYTLLRQLAAVAGLRDTRITPHMFRHACASRMADHGVPLPVVQTLLGHSDIVTTARYLHVNERLAKTHAEATAIRTPSAESNRAARLPTAVKPAVELPAPAQLAKPAPAHVRSSLAPFIGMRQNSERPMRSGRVFRTCVSPKSICKDMQVRPN